MSVKGVSLESRDLTAQVYGNGSVEAKVVVGVSSKITGRVVELHVDQGDMVKKGQLLARLEDTDFAQQVQQASATALKGRADREADAATYQKARANLELAEKNMRRFNELAAKDFVSKQEAEQYETAYLVAKEELRRSKAAMESTRMGESAAQANTRYTVSKQDDTLISAPQDGLVISRNLELGAIVTPGQSIFDLTDPQTVWVKANVDESQMRGVAVGKKAVITLRSRPGEQFEGKVVRVGRQSDRVTEESEVDVGFTAVPEDFRLGEQADVYIVVATKKAVPTIPAAAVVWKMKKRGVWTVAGGRLAYKEITGGIVDRRGFLEVTGGLGPDEIIAVAPTLEMQKFENGMRAKVVK
ncbi:MAG: efflux RND transporter periplasmic adaptor subunit [Humidesulfovibrio sp.]|nr:efflux RND transporter periplasmic adaptor subunit [Humidesulfovibrio sp.]